MKGQAKSLKSMMVLLLLLTPQSFWRAEAAVPTAKGGSLGARTNDNRQHLTLAADATWQLNTPNRIRFDASGLAFHQGKLLTLSDRGPELFEIAFNTNSTADLKKTAFFATAALIKAAGRGGLRFDCEGVSVDAAGNIYVCEESQRNIFKSSPDGKKLELLHIDWAPVKRFFGPDPNASFEGLALGPDTLYVANERDSARIIVVDLPSLKVTDSFAVDSDGFAFGGPHYSDLAYADGHLFILDRNHRVIFEVDPQEKKVLTEYNFGQMELAPDLAYKTLYPTGTMEGLAVDEKYFWLVTDNNGLPRFKYPTDIRPTLFRCKRPGR